MRTLSLSALAFALALTSATARPSPDGGGIHGALAPITVTIETGSVTAGSDVTVPIAIGDLGGQAVLAYQIEVTYDPAVVTALDPSTSGTLTSQWSTASNTSTPGRLVISAASAMALSGSGTLIELQFRGVAPGETSLTFAEVTLNEGDPAADAVDGGVTVSGSTDVAGGPEPFSFEVAPPYPNPTAGGVVVRVYSDLDQDASVQVFDVTGRAVSVLDVVRLSAGAATTVRLASGDLPAGTYSVAVASRGRTRSVRVVVAR